MAEERNRVLAGECISRAQVEATPAPSLDDIAAAADACDHERAALLSLARAYRGEAVPVETIMRVLPGIELPAVTCALIAIASGDRARLLELLEHRRFPPTKDAIDLEVLVLVAAWRAGAPLPRVIPELRRVAARATTAEAYGLLATMAAAIDDPHVQTSCKAFAGYAKEYAKQVAADERAMTASVKDVIASLPAVVETSRAAGFTVRAAQTVGRNDPCPCGSGLKYKKCCADKPAATPSPIAGVSWEDFLAGDKLLEEHVATLPLRELVRVDATRMRPAPLTAAARRFMRAREWDHASRIVNVLVEKTGDAYPRGDLANALLECHEIERARAEIGKLPPELAKNFDLELAIIDRSERAWPELVEHCARILRSDDKLVDAELAYALLHQAPEVGIVFARACIASLRFDDPDLLLEAVEDARDRLGLPPTDPAWTVLDALSARPSKQKRDEDPDKLRAALGESSARIDQLERTLAAMRAELDDARTRPAAELMRAPEVRDALDGKVRELEALIREGNAERRELRKQLEAATTAAAPSDDGRRRHTEARDDDTGEGDELEPGARGITLPRFDRRASDAFAEVPAQVASEAMRTIGTLAAGDGFAWRGVKQAKDMTRQVLMARVGIHHRLLFRVENGVMDVLDLITREQLMTTLKRLRAR